MEEPKELHLSVLNTISRRTGVIGVTCIFAYSRFYKTLFESTDDCMPEPSRITACIHDQIAELQLLFLGVRNLQIHLAIDSCLQIDFNRCCALLIQHAVLGNSMNIQKNAIATLTTSDLGEVSLLRDLSIAN